MYFLFIALISIPATSGALADVWEIQIPTDASKIDSKAHFIPVEISIKPNDMVIWGNGDGEAHTITSGSLETGSDGKFDSGFLKPGRQFMTGFDEEFGEIKYFCIIHPWMIGIINIVDLPEGYQVFHNVGSKVADTSFDIQYKVQRNLSDVTVEPARKMLVFSFVGKIDNDLFVVNLPEELIKNPQTVWVGNEQIMNFSSESSEGFTKMSIPLDAHTAQIKIVGTETIGETPKNHIC
ncbi:MAG: hypothetical protein HKP31_09295 [Nitrosopumilus sp.]|nr:hypothetical protein [Nitrosopumilus sp.]